MSFFSWDSFPSVPGKEEGDARYGLWKPGNVVETPAWTSKACPLEVGDITPNGAQINSLGPKTTDIIMVCGFPKVNVTHQKLTSQYFISFNRQNFNRS